MIRFNYRRALTQRNFRLFSSSAEKPVLPSRFWKEVTVSKADQAGKLTVATSESYNILLDGRKLKTPSGNALNVKSYPLALMVASEWHTQEKTLKAASLPITSLVARAQECFASEQERRDVINQMVKYFDTDTICYFHDTPPKLMEMQQNHWKPLIESIEKQFEIKVKTTSGLVALQQPQKSKQVLEKHLQTFDNTKLAAFEKICRESKSFLVALALVERMITVQEAEFLARLETLVQIEMFGEVEDAHDVDQVDMRRQLGAAVLTITL